MNDENNLSTHIGFLPVGTFLVQRGKSEGEWVHASGCEQVVAVLLIPVAGLSAPPPTIVLVLDGLFCYVIASFGEASLYDFQSSW